MSVNIIDCTASDELFRHYDGQSEQQPAYLELDLREGTLLADYDSEVGGAVPFSVYHGFERRYGIPTLTGDAANRVMREIAPLAERILGDWKEDWDGNNMRAYLGDDAQAAEAEIEECLGLKLGYGDDPNQGFDDSDLVVMWDIDGAVNGQEASEYNITGDTTDARLDEIEQEILKDLAECGPAGVVVCHGLDGYLRNVRDELAEDEPLTGAELRAARELLGITSDHLAKVIGVNPRTVRSWEQGRDAVPGRIRPELAEIKQAADAAVRHLVAGLGDDDDAVITYRTDEEYKAAHPSGNWSAAWHRQVALRAAVEAGVRLDYADEDGE